MSHHRNELNQPIGAPVAEWSARPLPPRSPLTGSYCTLLPLDLQAHAEPLYRAYAAAADARHWTYLSYGPFTSLDGYRAWMQATCGGDDPLFYAIAARQDGSAPPPRDEKTAAGDTPLGVASYLRIEPAIGVIEVGHIHYAPALQRTPAATEAMFLMMKRVFDELGYRRYEWKCDALNERSRRAAVRLGFTFEGVFRQATMYKGRNRDTAWFSITDKEWQALKGAYEAWLAPTNFDAQGKQRARLGELIARVR